MFYGVTIAMVINNNKYTITNRIKIKDHYKNEY